MSFVESTTSKANDYFSRLEVDGEEGGEFIDHWDTGELLFLASSVQRSDRNWASVARGLKLYGEQARPADFYTPKNCALQYTKLLSEVDEDSKKKTLPRTERETSEAMLVKNLTDKRLNELAWLNQQTKSAANVLKTYAEMVENGDFDDQLDDLLKNIEEKEKREEEKYLEYISKRESLNATKKLNKSRLVKGKASKVIDSKKKNSPFSDMSEESPSKTSVAEVVKNIKKEIEEEELAASTKHVKTKSELDTNISLNALLDSKITMPSSVSPTSPLLTSLLRTITSTNSVSQSLPPLSNSPLKETDHSDIDLPKSETDIGGFLKSKEVSPRGSVPQSPRPTPSSSPLLNSLLKNSPSSSTMASKDVSPKAVSSPQPFFNPSSVLASAAAQQLAVATSTPSLSHQFFPQEVSESRKAQYQSSPVTSACLAAPTLSKLLEMPPSTPGRLPPLPVLDPPLAAAVSMGSPLPVKLAAQKLQNEVKSRALEFSPSKKILDKGTISVQHVSEPQISVACSSDVTVKTTVADTGENKKVVAFDISSLDVDSDVAVSKNVALLEEICESFKDEIMNEEIVAPVLDKPDQDSPSFFCVDTKQDITTKTETFSGTDSSAVELLNDIKIEPLEDLPEDIKPDINLSENVSGINESATNAVTPKVEEFEKETSRKIFKSRPAKKLSTTEQDSAVKVDDATTPALLTPVQIKIEPESPSKKMVHVKIEPESPSKNCPSFGSGDETGDKFSESKSEKGSEIKSPVSKKPKIYENISSEKQDLSEDEMPSAVRRSGRKSKKSRGRGSKPPPSKPAEPKDQYEFTESAEENSVGYQTSNALCYGPRLKEGSRFEDKTKPLAQDSEDTPRTSSTDSPIVEKKSSPIKNKPGRPIQSSSRGKSPFATDEDAVSDSFTSDDASNSVLTEDKLKKWEESTEKQSDITKVSESIKTLQKSSKVGESAKKKQSVKRHLSNKSNPPSKKERKMTSSDFDDLSACSRDSEDVSSVWKQEKDSADQKKIISLVESKAEATDSHMSSSVTAESEPMDDIESLQGSITTEFSPLPVSEPKDEKDTSHFGKQEWFQGVSPKSSEHVSQSSEESEYESDNWDSHSVSTNKSASHSSDPQPRSKRKEKESPEYKAWKKAIHIVLREASCHKYANVFLQKVTNDVAPGYSSIVYRPMDLSLIKKNIDNGIVKTTDEFHRDMLLMFQNAIMYNSSDHDVFKMALEMQDDVILQIKAFLVTQNNDKEEHNEPTSSLRGARTAKSQKGAGKQSTGLSTTPKTKEETERD